MWVINLNGNSETSGEVIRIIWPLYLEFNAFTPGGGKQEAQGCTLYAIPVCCRAFIAAFLQSTRVSDVALWNTSTALPINNPACAPPENPGNGYLLPVYGPQDKLVAVRYKCYPPFTLIGSHQRVCQRDATWSGTVPVCVKGAPHNSSFCMFIHTWCIS